ncbi:hypothetical protein IEO21_03425 [Rhodonia placenta]|uniref:ATP11-domain-containing protein n=1 Tax=Rhodonia placenta TaxID=104341 RepID=A0A8H7P5S0_9APHY|nr:hypothetical protein IEO21_03425 [Postia placenta]
MLKTGRALRFHSGRRVLRSSFCSCAVLRNDLSQSRTINYEAKYTDKLQKRAQEQGKSVTDLLNELKEQEKEKRRQRLAAEARRASSTAESASQSTSTPLTSASSTPSSSQSTGRRDSSPVKPLNSIFNLDRLLSSPHTPEQLSMLWRAYHSSRSGGTGRGFLSASVTVNTYSKMMDVALKYPTFVVPVPSPKTEATQGDDNPAYEFYFMQWDFHGPPRGPLTTRDIFEPHQPSPNPQTSTILFTPLQEYKMRNSFATPYLVMTHYTDLAKSHGMVLLRGEITPSTSSPGAGAAKGDGRYMLSQQDAQLLAIAVQRFYLWSDGENERTALLKAFHEKPDEFSWEELLKHIDYSI